MATQALPIWFDLARQTATFLLGVAVMIYSIVAKGSDIALVVTGLILIGLVPVDRAVSLLVRGHDFNGASSGSP